MRDSHHNLEIPASISGGNASALDLSAYWGPWRGSQLPAPALFNSTTNNGNLSGYFIGTQDSAGTAAVNFWETFGYGGGHGLVAQPRLRPIREHDGKRGDRVRRAQANVLL